MRGPPPMNAPWPPPTMPRRMRRGAATPLLPSIVICVSRSTDAEHLLVRRQIDAAAGEVVERPIGNADDVVGDEDCALPCAILRVLEAAFPLHHRPAREVIGGHLGEDRAEVDLPVAERTEASGAIDPRLEAAVHALPAGRVELGVLDVEDLDALVVDVDVVEVV